MPINQLLPFGTGAGANVLDFADYQALAARQTGFQSGTALSIQLNTAWRQSAFAASMLGQYVVDQTGLDVFDNGDVSAFEANFLRALRAQKPNYVSAGGTANALTITLTPAPASWADLIGVPLRIVASAANTGAATLAVTGLTGTKSIVHPDGTPLLPRDIATGHIGLYIYDGTNVQLAAAAQIADPNVNFKAYTTSNRNVASGINVIQFDAKLAGSHAGMVTGPGSKFTAPVAGWYMLFMSVVSGTGTGYLGGGLRMNGSSNLASAVSTTASYSNATLSASTIHYLSVGDYIEAYTSTGGTSQINADIGTSLSGSLLKAA